LLLKELLIKVGTFILKKHLLMLEGPLSALFDTPLQVLTGTSGYRQVLPAAPSTNVD
jgi:hypothetical protein